MGNVPNLEINCNLILVMKRRLYLFINATIILGSLLITSCGGGENVSTANDQESKSNGTIGVSVLTLGNPFFSVIAENIKSEAAKHGYDVIIVDGDRNVQKQANQIDDFLTKGVAAIVLNPCDRISTGAAIKKANEAGIPVFTCDLKCVAEGAEVVSHVGSDNLQGGKLAGEAMIEALGDNGGSSGGSFSAGEFLPVAGSGFKEVINAYNQEKKPVNCGGFGIGCGGVRDEGYKVTEDTLQAHPDLAGIFAINDPSALGAELLKSRKAGSRKIVAFDGQPEGKQAIKDGKIYADPVQFPDKIGTRTVGLILSYFNGEEVPAEVLIPTELYRQEDGLQMHPLNK